MFKPETKSVSPVTTAVARLDVGVATTTTEVVPNTFSTVSSSTTATPSTVIALKVFTAEG